MGIVDRMRAAQAKALARNRRMEVIGATALEVADDLGRMVHVLRGNCPRCGVTNDVSTERTVTTVQTSCVACTTSFTMQA